MTQRAEPAGAPFVDASDLPSARRLADCALLTADLRFVSECCNRLVAEENADEGVVKRALWLSAVVAYARCFGTGVRRGLTIEVYEDLGLDGAREFHQTLIDFRNKHVAHSVNAFEEARVGVLLSEDSSEIAGGAVLNFALVGREDEEIRDFGRLATALLSHVLEEGRSAQDALTKEAQGRGASAFADRAPIRLVAPHPDDAGVPRGRADPGDDPFVRPTGHLR